MKKWTSESSDICGLAISRWKKKKKFNRRLDEQDNRENILGNVLVA